MENDTLNIEDVIRNITQEFFSGENIESASKVLIPRTVVLEQSPDVLIASLVLIEEHLSVYPRLLKNSNIAGIHYIAGKHVNEARTQEEIGKVYSFSSTTVGINAYKATEKLNIIRERDSYILPDILKAKIDKKKERLYREYCLTF